MTFDELQRKLKLAGVSMGASELHGLLTAVAAKSGFQDLALELPFAQWFVVGAPATEFAAELTALATELRDRLAPYAEYDLVILLPSDDAPLFEQWFELTCWCAGFLSGLSETRGLIEQLAESDVGELIEDLSTISKTGSDIADGEENERDFAEILEFVRVAVLNIAAELFEQRQSKVIQH